MSVLCTLMMAREVDLVVVVVAYKEKTHNSETKRDETNDALQRRKK